MEREHFGERRSDARKQPGPAGVKRNQFGAHSILALEELFARGYLQIQVESGEVGRVERTAGGQFVCQTAEERSEIDEFAQGHGAGKLPGEIPVLEDGGDPGGVSQMVGGLAEAVPFEGVGQIEPEELPAETRGDVIVCVYFHGNALNAFDSLQPLR